MTSVLLVEDEPDVRFTVRLSLQLADYRVEEATTGEEALQLLFTGARPDAIVLDLRLPGMDGMEVLRRIQEDQSLRGIPVIILSAHASQWRAAAALKLGCHTYLTKPVSQERLREVIAQAVAARRSEQGSAE